MIEGFKKFIARGNMIDMAVGVVMGGAVTTEIYPLSLHDSLPILPSPQWLTLLSTM